MKMKTLYAALSGALLLGAATLAPAQTATPSSAPSAAPSGSATNPNKSGK